MCVCVCVCVFDVCVCYGVVGVMESEVYQSRDQITVYSFTYLLLHVPRTVFYASLTFIDVLWYP